MKRIIIATLAFAALTISSCATHKSPVSSEVTMTKEVLMDKIRGAWAGQIIGCTYGGPTEFRYATIINENVNIPWDEHIIKRNYDYNSGLYDDVYMDLTFVDVFERCGLDAPVDSFAKAFAYAGYSLWHANSQARYNIVNGIMPPASGYWENNPHADDIDFQIEADYAGIMSPGMPVTSEHYCNGIGHMMNYGDGYYGGVYVAAMYSLAFVSDDIRFIVEEALKMIPQESRFHKCMSDVIKWSKEYEDWQQTWLYVNRDYNFDIGCPEGVYNMYDIDAVLNSAYIVIGLLYGNKDFYKTLDISCRCGADSDCNPASAGGILATVLGYDGIPEYWRGPLKEVADQNFKYTDISFNKASDLSFRHALQVIAQNGGQVTDSDVVIKTQTPQAIPFEVCFNGHWPVSMQNLRKTVDAVDKISFEGNGIVIRYEFVKGSSFTDTDYAAEVEVMLDGNLSKTVHLPATGKAMSPEFYYVYNLPVGEHTLTFNWVNKCPGLDIRLSRYIVYSDGPKMTKHQ